MNKVFRIWSARFLLLLGVLVIVVGALSLNLTPIVAGAVLLGLGHGILAVHELSAQTKALLSVAHGAIRRERNHEASSAYPVAAAGANRPSLRDDPADAVEPYAESGERARA